MTTPAHTRYVMSEDLTMKGMKGAAKAGDGYAKIVLAKLESKKVENDNASKETINDHRRTAK